MELLFGIITGLLILVFLVVVHELGHAVAAIKSGVVLEEFGVGFPPRAWGRKLKNGALLTINWLPLGGFVRFKGEHDSASEKGDYGAATYWQKTKILFAGVAMNWLVAVILLTILAWTGMPKILPNQFSVESDTKIVNQAVEVGQVIPKSPADKAGLKLGDKILRFAGEPVPSSEALVKQTNAYKGQDVELVYARGGKEYVTRVQLNPENEANKGYLGVGPTQRERIQAGWSAPVVGVATTAQLSWVTLVEVKNVAVRAAEGAALSLVNTFSEVVLRKEPNTERREQASKNLSEAGGSVAGPIGILGVIFPAAGQAGLTELVFLTAIISLTLAVMNILPIPALDGGRWTTMTLFRLLRKPLTKEKEEAIQATGFMMLMILVVVVTIADVSKFF